MKDIKIIICYDGSDAAKEAIERTAILHPGEDVAILTAWQPMDAFASSWLVMAGELGDLDEAAELAARRCAATGATLARAAGLYPHEYVTRAPISVARTILDWCDAIHPQMVVVGSSGHSALGDAVTGSVASSLVHHAPMPVLVVRRPKPTPDHSPQARRTATATH